MIAAMRFSFRYYFRSNRYVSPLTLYIIAIIFIYGIVPNPVLPSYGFTSTVLFLVSAWLCFTFIDVEEQTQQMISVLHLGNVTKYYMARMLVIGLIGSGLALGTTLYPIAFDRFGVQPTVEQIVVGLVSHLLLSYLGIAIAALFTSKLVRRLDYSILGLFLILSISLGGVGISRSLPDSISFLSWLVPPLYRIMSMLNNDVNFDIYDALIGFIVLIIYTGVLQVIFFKWMKRKLF